MNAMPDGAAALETDDLDSAGLEDAWGAPPAALLPDAPRIANKRAPTDADAAVGRRIRDCRIAKGMSLSELSGQVGVSQPQLYRYECGLTRVAASRLISIAACLGVSIETLARGSGPTIPVPTGAMAEAELLLRAFSNIGQPERRSALIALARSMADTDAIPVA
jgi:transcriptional regulator with XRE-family HTH domain